MTFFLVDWLGWHLSFVMVCFFVSFFTFFVRRLLVDDDKVGFFEDRLKSLTEELEGADDASVRLGLNRECLKVQNRMVWEYAKGFVVFGVVVFAVLPFMSSVYGNFYFVNFPWLGFKPDFLLYYIVFTILFNFLFSKVSDWINNDDSVVDMGGVL